VLGHDESDQPVGGAAQLITGFVRPNNNVSNTAVIIICFIFIFSPFLIVFNDYATSMPEIINLFAKNP
jgi:hypothetical protein